MEKKSKEGLLFEKNSLDLFERNKEWFGLLFIAASCRQPS
jgi:hypothetical protein